MRRKRMSPGCLTLPGGLPPPKARKGVEPRQEGRKDSATRLSRGGWHPRSVCVIPYVAHTLRATDSTVQLLAAGLSRHSARIAPVSKGRSTTALPLGMAIGVVKVVDLPACRCNWDLHGFASRLPMQLGLTRMRPGDQALKIRSLCPLQRESAACPARCPRVVRAQRGHAVGVLHKDVLEGQYATVPSTRSRSWSVSRATYATGGMHPSWEIVQSRLLPVPACLNDVSGGLT